MVRGAGLVHCVSVNAAMLRLMDSVLFGSGANRPTTIPRSKRRRCCASRSFAIPHSPADPGNVGERCIKAMRARAWNANGGKCVFSCDV